MYRMSIVGRSVARSVRTVLVAYIRVHRIQEVLLLDAAHDSIL